MSDVSRSCDPAYFEHLYEHAEDPWDFRTSQYERRKYEATLAALPQSRFRACLEVGCSIGELTYLLSYRCDSVLGLDTAAAPLAAARTKCAKRAGVRFEQMHVPAQWPEGHYDLIILSEVLYFLSPADIASLSKRADRGLLKTGAAILVNWLGPTGTVCNGDDAAARFIAASKNMHVVNSSRNTSYRIDVLAKSPRHVS